MGENPCCRCRVLFASSGVGAGHNQASKSLLAGLRAVRPDIPAQHVDVLDFTSVPFRLYYAGGYATMVSWCPWLFGLAYRFMNRPTTCHRDALERIRLRLERWATRRFHRWLLQQRPVVVVNTHYLSPPGIGYTLGAGTPGIQQMVAVTDYEIHRWWYSEHVERYFVANESSRAALIEYGIADARIEMTGIPVHPKWTESVDDADARIAWGIPADATVVVLCGGVEFAVGWFTGLARALCRGLPNAYVFALCGTNKRLLARLSDLPAAHGDGPHLRVCGFTDRIDELIGMASVVVTKAGGMITTECLNQGAAMVIPHPIPGQESANAMLLRQQDAALVARSPKQVVDMTTSLLRDPARREQLSRNAKRLARPATERICEIIAESVDRIDRGT